MQVEKYPVAVGKTSMVFEFTSEGVKGSIPKLVVYDKTHLHGLYNLGFGDKDDKTGAMDDSIITNNGDGGKVLATVAFTLYAFMEKFPDAIVLATGSTKARNRLYRIGISKHLEEISNDFKVYGLISGGSWKLFERQTDYEAFLVMKKNNIFII